MESWQQVVRRLKKIVDTVNMYHRKTGGAWAMLPERFPALADVHKITGGNHGYFVWVMAGRRLRKRISGHVSSSPIRLDVYE